MSLAGIYGMYYVVNERIQYTYQPAPPDWRERWAAEDAAWVLGPRITMAPWLVRQKADRDMRKLLDEGYTVMTAGEEIAERVYLARKADELTAEMKALEEQEAAYERERMGPCGHCSAHCGCYCWPEGEGDWIEPTWA